MVRLGVLVLVTLAGFVLLLSLLGDGNPRAERRPVTAPQPAARDAGLPAPVAAEAAPVVPAALVEARSQTPERVQRFPGPPLRPSPEYGSESSPASPALADAGGPVAYVTGDRVNMRAGPSTGDRVVASLGRGSPVTPLGPLEGEWVNIRDGQGRIGYIAGRFLSSEAP